MTAPAAPTRPEVEQHRREYLEAGLTAIEDVTPPARPRLPARRGAVPGQHARGRQNRAIPGEIFYRTRPSTSLTTFRP